MNGRRKVTVWLFVRVTMVSSFRPETAAATKPAKYVSFAASSPPIPGTLRPNRANAAWFPTPLSATGAPMRLRKQFEAELLRRPQDFGAGCVGLCSPLVGSVFET